MPKKKANSKSDETSTEQQPAEETVAAVDEQDNDDNDDDEGKESKGKMKKRHLKEVKDFERKSRETLNKVPKNDKKAKQAAEALIKKQEQEMKQRHQKELESVEEQQEEKEDVNQEEPVEAVTEQLGATTITAEKKIGKAQKRRNAQAAAEKEREERIKEEKKNYVSQRQVENQALAKKLTPLKLCIKEIAPDGNCLYSAVADQLELQGHKTGKEYYKTLRKIVADFMWERADEFMPFADSEEASSSQDGFKKYCDTVANTTAWGGQLELKALVGALKSPITIYTADEKAPNIEMGKEYSTQPLILTYHRHAYLLGEHYNSVVPMPAEAEVDD